LTRIRARKERNKTKAMRHEEKDEGMAEKGQIQENYVLIQLISTFLYGKEIRKELKKKRRSRGRDPAHSMRKKL